MRTERIVPTRPGFDAGPARWRIDGLAALALLAGTVLALQLPSLPSWPVQVGAIVLAMLAALWRPVPRVVAWCLFGFALASWHADRALKAQLPLALDAAEVELVVEVVDLPEVFDDGVRFDARVREAVGEASSLRGQRLRLAWYGPGQPQIHPGQLWKLKLKLRRPRGLVNPGGFDFERYAVYRGIAASGYVRQPTRAERLQEAQGLDALRARIAERITALAPSESERFLRGLAVGDTRGLSDVDWETLRATGLSHLLAISGLHIGLVAGLAALLMRLPYGLWPTLALRWPRPQAAALAALIAAAAYSALAGFGLPTVRTLAMLAVVLCIVLLRRRVRLSQALALALVVIVLTDPLAVLGAGFWLSFAGVAWLLLCLPLRVESAARVRSLFTAQWIMALGLLPLTVLFFGQSSLVGAALNILAVPWVNLLVVPLTLLGVAVLPWDGAAQLVFAAAGTAMEGLWWLADHTASLSWAQAHWPAPTLVSLLLAVLGCILLLSPRGLPGRGVGWILVLPLLWPVRGVPAAGQFEAWVFDVGQGLSVLVRTREHALLFDSGPRLRSGRDLGDAAVIPSLRALGLDRLDRLLISHGDSDHAGGLRSLRLAFAEAEIESGEPRRLAVADRCERGERWDWDGVRFELLHPPAHFPELGNESSCVLRVEGAAGSMLLPGDIGSLIESRLVGEADLRSDILLAPHHGSRSSSQIDFIHAVDPNAVVFSTGHGNRFGHPAAEVVERYRVHGSALYDTAEHGALHLRWEKGRLQVRPSRLDAPRWWRARPVANPTGDGAAADSG